MTWTDGAWHDAGQSWAVAKGVATHDYGAAYPYGVSSYNNIGHHIGLTAQFVARLLAAILFVALIASCNPRSDPALRIGTNVWPGYEPLYLARELKYFDDSTIRLVEYFSASQVIRAFRNGAIDAAALTLDEVLLLQQHDVEAKIVLVMDVSHGGDAIIAQSRYRSLKELKGKRIGVEDTALGAYVLIRALDQAGIKRKDIKKVSLEVDQHERAFLDRRVDAVVTFEPVRTKLLAAGGRKLFDSSQIPGEIVDVLVVRNDFMVKYPERLQFLLRQWFRALVYMHDYPELAAVTIARRLGIPEADVPAAYQGLKLPGRNENYRLLFAHKDKPPILLGSAKQLSQVMRDQALLTDDATPEFLI